MANYTIGVVVPSAPSNSFAVCPAGRNDFTANQLWSKPNMILGPGEGFMFYNPDAAVWSLMFAGDAVMGAPVVLIPPQSVTTGFGDTATFTIYAGGDTTLTYQWRHEGTNLTGAAGTSLTLNNIQADQAGAYTVAVSNSVGFAISTQAVLTVVSPAATLAGQQLVNGMFGFQVNGLPNRLYVVQSNPTLDPVSWTSIFTNNGAVPFQFSEPAGGPRYYRAVYRHEQVAP